MKGDQAGLNKSLGIIPLSLDMKTSGQVPSLAKLLPANLILV